MNSRSGPGRLILVRHGESVGNRDQRFTISPAATLTDLGRRQAREAAARIARLFKPEHVVASPYARARETGEIIALELGLKIDFEEGLREQSFGQLAGHSYDVLSDDPTYDPSRAWLYRPPSGETREEVRIRIAPVFDRIVAAYGERELVVVSHGGVMQALWAHLTGRWEDAHLPPNTGIVTLDHAGGRYSKPRVISD